MERMGPSGPEYMEDVSTIQSEGLSTRISGASTCSRRWKAISLRILSLQVSVVFVVEWRIGFGPPNPYEMGDR